MGSEMCIRDSYSATAAEQSVILLFLDYVEAGEATTLDNLNALRAQLYADACNVFGLDPAVFNPAEAIQICTRQMDLLTGLPRATLSLLFPPRMPPSASTGSNKIRARLCISRIF